MKRPIAMKCTQEQFEAIEPKLKNNVNDIKNLDSFQSFEYLTNFFRREENCISNLSKRGFWYNEKTLTKYEEWNEKIFLEACGIEVEKTFSITESQIKEIYETIETHIPKYSKDRLKEWFPEAFYKISKDEYVAEEQEVFEALKNEAVKRGFVEGVMFNIVNGEREPIHIKSNVRYGFDNFGNKLLMNGWCIFEHGNWSIPFETITLSEAEQQLKKKIIV